MGILKGTRATVAGLMLLGLLAQMAPAIAQQTDSDATDAQQGRELAFDRSKGNCLACHQIEGGDLAGNIGPPLVQMKARYPDRNKLFARIWDETQFNSMTVMPPFGRNKILEKQEIRKIVDFLYTL